MSCSHRSTLFHTHIFRTTDYNEVLHYSTYLPSWKRQELFACSFAYLSTQWREQRSLAAKCWHCCCSLALPLLLLFMFIYCVWYLAGSIFPTSPRFTNSSIVLIFLLTNILILHAPSFNRSVTLYLHILLTLKLNSHFHDYLFFEFPSGKATSL